MELPAETKYRTRDTPTGNTAPPTTLHPADAVKVLSVPEAPTIDIKTLNTALAVLNGASVVFAVIFAPVGKVRVPVPVVILIMPVANCAAVSVLLSPVTVDTVS